MDRHSYWMEMRIMLIYSKWFDQSKPILRLYVYTRPSLKLCTFKPIFSFVSRWKAEVNKKTPITIHYIFLHFFETQTTNWSVLRFFILNETINLSQYIIHQWDDIFLNINQSNYTLFKINQSEEFLIFFINKSGDIIFLQINQYNGIFAFAKSINQMTFMFAINQSDDIIWTE